MTMLKDANVSLCDLTEKQRQVLDLILEHKSSKEIARTLCISPYTVDQRIVAARNKLGAQSRGELARLYSQLKETYGEPAYQFPHVVNDDAIPQKFAQVVQDGPVFTLADAASLELPTPWANVPNHSVGLEALDRRFGVFGRLLAIGALAALLALAILAVVSIAETLTTLI